MSGTVTVFVVSPDTRSERRYDLHLTVGQLKTKLESVTGIPVSAQQITLHNNEDDSAIATLDDDSKPLGFYSLRDWQALKVSDTSPPGLSLTGQFTDVSQVDKFELTDAEYASRRDTVLAYKQRNKLGRFADSASDSVSNAEASATTDPSALGIEPGKRCEVDPATEGGIVRRGTIRFVGPTSFGTGQGIWVGIEYDEPVGKNNGSVSGKTYFSCPNNFGGFVRPEKVRVGDYPPISLDDELEEM
ncbi:tubulin-folding cofactor B [Pyrrhoderma noxium]|uniref:Tubulin-folding cofactor B n=1 Tax=Pyrrhoderma noxium TaxID=2282107 RepID=A0A286UJP4_9AGAM|nr:tubulin-folding cofactor B [Pyrrhoderma noxium]